MTNITHYTVSRHCRCRWRENHKSNLTPCWLSALSGALRADAGLPVDSFVARLGDGLRNQKVCSYLLIVSLC